jgi:hypothetical protein
MDHAEAHERIADLILEPPRLEALQGDPSAEAVALRAHVERCDDCRAEIDGWRRIHGTVLSTLAGLDAGDLESPASTADMHLRAPASLRAAVAAMPRSREEVLPSRATVRGTAPEASHRRSMRRLLPSLAAAAAVIVAIGSGVVAIDQARQAEAGRRQAAELTELAASVAHVLSDPDHVSIALVGLDGAPAGSAAWSGDEYVITTTALATPLPGSEYRCWLERDGIRTPIGVMRSAAGTTYWWGRVDVERGHWRAGGQLGVSLETIGENGSGAPILIGRLAR